MPDHNVCCVSEMDISCLVFGRCDIFHLQESFQGNFNRKMGFISHGLCEKPRIDFVCKVFHSCSLQNCDTCIWLQQLQPMTHLYTIIMYIGLKHAHEIKNRQTKLR